MSVCLAGRWCAGLFAVAVSCADSCDLQITRVSRFIGNEAGTPLTLPAPQERDDLSTFHSIMNFLI